MIGFTYEVDTGQVGKAFVQLGFEFTVEFVNDLIKEFDYSEDGLIQLDEFIDMIEATLIVQVSTCIQSKFLCLVKQLSRADRFCALQMILNYSIACSHKTGGAMCGQEDKAEEVIVSESPWGMVWQMEVDVNGNLDEDSQK
jgi:hypothetical protein